ncbi:MAG: sulfurtransferase TusA family protein [Litorivicinaceae bacterium]
MRTLDCADLKCPLPLLKLKVAINDDCSDRSIRLLTTDPISLRDIPAFCKRTGHHLASINEGPLLEFIIELRDN